MNTHKIQFDQTIVNYNITHKNSFNSTGCARYCDLNGQKYNTPIFLGFFGFVKTIKMLITQKNSDTSTKSEIGHDAPK